MRVKEQEVEKVKNSEIKRFEKTLNLIDNHEEIFLESFDKNIQAILGDLFVPILREIQNHPELTNRECNIVRINNSEYKIPKDFLLVFHKSYISDAELRKKFEDKLKEWFTSKTEKLKESINNKDSYDDIENALPEAFALASIALTAFHKYPNMILRDVQKMTGIAISEGSIAELGTGEGKTLSAVLPTYLFALRGKGSHVITANDYLAKRDYEETLPIFAGLGLTSGYIPEDETSLAEIEGKDPTQLTGFEKIKYQQKLKKIKQAAYQSDITYGSKQTFAFDYLRDNSISKREDMLQREEKPGFALIDEVDDCLIDDAQVPYRIAVKTPMYVPNMSLRDLCIIQDIPFDIVLYKSKELGINPDSLSYEEARFISNTFGRRELLPDPRKYQEAAQLFFKMQKVFVTEDNTFGFKTGKELYKALLDEDMYEADEIRSNYGIILCRELKEYKVSDKCFEEFLKYCYLSFQINSVAVRNQTRIIHDLSYKKGEDYYIHSDGRLRLTKIGADKIIQDKSYPEFVDNYNKYLSTVSTESAALIHYFQQAVVANLLMKNGEDYIIDNGTVKTLKNGRIQEGSTYTNGLHQAIEIKEKIPVDSRTKDTTASSTITQKDFYSRYDLFSGMTGTSSKGVFSEVFGKDTVEIPKHAFYSFYGARKKKDAKEPIGVERRKTEFTLTLEEKIKLIVDSIIESRSKEPKQPVLLVVSDIDEIRMLQEALISNGIVFNTLTATTKKEEEALIIAKAGLPGMVTISTEMAGRGTDIKIGGDRDTIIDIATERHIRKLEKKLKRQLDFTPAERDFLRKKVETALVADGKIKLWTKDKEESIRQEMESTGLKVISSGFFKIDRIDRQLEGRTGRNGISGVCERFAYPEDIKRLGLTSFNMKDSIADSLRRFRKKANGALDIDDSSYKSIMSKILSRQKNIEGDIKESIKATQKMDSYATQLVEQYRDKRRNIVCDKEEVEPLILKMIENATDAIISSYIVNKELTKDDLRTPINKSSLRLNAEAISLEVKQILGISFDPSVIEKSNINLMELRDAIIRTAQQRYKELNVDNCKEALLTQNDYMIANLPDVLEHSFAVKRLTSIVAGMEDRVEYEADIAFERARKRLELESCRQGAKKAMGLPLSIEEFRRLEALKNNLFSMNVSSKEESEEQYEVTEAEYQENNTSVLSKFKAIKAKIEEKNQKELAKVEQRIDRAQAKGKPVDIAQAYSNLEIRPLMIINAMVNGKNVSRLVIVRDGKKIEQQKGASLV